MIGTVSAVGYSATQLRFKNVSTPQATPFPCQWFWLLSWHTLVPVWAVSDSEQTVTALCCITCMVYNSSIYNHATERCHGDRTCKMFFATEFPVTLCLALALAASQQALAVNDWSIPCTQGHCSWDIPADSGASGTVHIVSLRFIFDNSISLSEPVPNRDLFYT